MRAADCVERKGLLKLEALNTPRKSVINGSPKPRRPIGKFSFVSADFCVTATAVPGSYSSEANSLCLLFERDPALLVSENGEEFVSGLTL